MVEVGGMESRGVVDVMQAWEDAILRVSRCQVSFGYLLEERKEGAITPSW